VTLIPGEFWLPSEGVRLDAETLAAVRAERSAVIVAGPGAGKTELLAQRAAYLLQTGACPAPRRILAISFKRDAAKNLRERVARRAGDLLGDRLESYTFDAFAKSLLDRFGSTLPAWCRPGRDYNLVFPGWRDWSEAADAVRSSGANLSGPQVNSRHATPLDKVGPLPLSRPPEQSLDPAGRFWWDRALGRSPSELTFGMIATLAMTILEHNSQVRQALCHTYSHVFLDEFQDTTTLQYGLLKTAFLGSGVILTAVGDTKQKIMTFAGAQDGIFKTFAEDFGATPIALTSNFRSSPRIVEIVNAMARELEPDAVPVKSARAASTSTGPSDGVVRFSGAQEEAQALAKWIAKEVAEGVCTPESYMLLVRQVADKAEAALAPAFAAQGLSLRNEARMVEGIQIQELMTEPLTDLAVAVLQMAIGDREGAPFQRARNMIGSVFGDADGRPASEARVERTIRDAVGIARAATAAAPDPTLARDTVRKIFGVLGETALARLSSDYAKPSRLAEIARSVGDFLAESSQGASTWPNVLRQFLGRDQVRLMTIHKSKGLEAHTVVFLHLQDDAFNAKADMDEEALAFFVAVSRAKDRFVITTTNANVSRVNRLWGMVQAAKIPTLGS
jgi:superfamily I DNA/RNA helicase